MKLRRLVLLLGSLWALGCGEENKTLTPADFSNRYAQAVCKGVSAACLIPEATCQAGQLAARASLDQLAVAQGRDFLPSNAQECLNQVSSVYDKVQQGAVALKAAEVQSVDQACADVYRGPKLANETCSADQNCVMGLICDHSKGTTTGRCGTKTEVLAGGGCANIGETCPSDSYCANSEGVFVCQPKLSLAGACTDSVPCLESLRCSGGLCVAQLGIGELCAADQDCTTGFCEPYARKCAVDVRFANGSAACLAMAGN